jgi:hypothetical protein
MKVTFIVTIDPVKDMGLLNVLVHSLNLQTSKAFSVVFYNQTLVGEDAILSALRIRPTFEYLFYSIDRRHFFGRYPVWDLYAFHNTLLDAGVVNEYFMSLHMEEFFDVDYVENAIKVLQERQFDIMFGNLSATRLSCGTIEPLLETRTAEEFARCVEQRGLKNSYHWSFGHRPLFSSRSVRSLRRELLHLYLFKFSRKVAATRTGYRRVGTYMAEDLYFMKREFAERYNWFLRGHRMYFEDIHICEQKGVCELGKELKKITEFPVYFNLKRIYHVTHGRYYFQLVDEEFTTSVLRHAVDDPILGALRKAISMYHTGQITLAEALEYTRKNPERTGTQNLNYQYHMKYLEQARTEARGEPR